MIGDFDVGQPDALFNDGELTDIREVEISPDGGPERKRCDSENNTDAFHSSFSLSCLGRIS